MLKGVGFNEYSVHAGRGVKRIVLRSSLGFHKPPNLRKTPVLLNNAVRAKPTDQHIGKRTNCSVVFGFEMACRCRLHHTGAMTPMDWIHKSTSPRPLRLSFSIMPSGRSRYTNVSKSQRTVEWLLPSRWLAGADSTTRAQ